MTRALLLLGLLAALPAASGTRSRSGSSERGSGDILSQYKVLRPGRYEIVLKGALCNACTRAIVEALSQLDGVQEASFDFEEGFLKLVIGRDKELKMAKVERTLARAARRVDLATRFSVREIRYSPK